VFRPISLERALDLRFRSDGEWIESDAQLLEQVLANLVANALRYTDEGGVLVAARARSNRVSLEVWDTGRGIATADGERIFEEFVQLDNLERDRRKGLGLGLSIAQRSAMLIGTRIALVSRIGRGTRFAILQSRMEPPSQLVGHPPLSVPRGAVPVSSRNSRPVLIVDDDRDVREALSDLLRRWDVRFEAVAEAETALDLVGAGEVFGLVLADYRLGGRMNGLDLIIALREAHVAPCPDAVLITGDFDASLIADADRHQVPVLHKPLKPTVLRRLLGLDERN
jgi:CheY-like chemotaxis protein